MTLTELIEQALRIIQPLVEKNYDKSLGFPSKIVFFNTLEWILKNLYSLKLLTKEISFESEHAISLVLRNMLSDFIINSYIINQSKDFNDSDDLFISLIHSDIKKIDSYFIELKEIGIISREEHEKYLEDNKANEIKHMVIKWYKEKNLKTFPTNKTIFNSIVSNDSSAPKNWKEDILNAYDIWVLLSKYEHIGWYSYSITRVIDVEKIKYRVRITIKLILFLSGNLFEYLDEDFEPKEIINLYEKINVD